MAVRITCINKDYGYHDNPHEAISYFGWINEATGENGKSTLAQMVEFIDTNPEGSAYVRVGSNQVNCYTRTNTRTGRRFVQTKADGTPTDNLLQLPECVG